MEYVRQNKVGNYTLHEFLKWVDNTPELHDPYFHTDPDIKEYCFAGICYALHKYLSECILPDLSDDERYLPIHYHTYVRKQIVEQHVHTLLLEIYPGAYALKVGEYFILQYARDHINKFKRNEHLNATEYHDFFSSRKQLREKFRDKMLARPDRIMSFLY